MDSNSIIAVQEHWLFNFESHQLENRHPDFKVISKCVDDADPISPLHKPRGYGGTAVFWHESIDKYVQVIDDGSPRILAVLLNFSIAPICIITSYMPARLGKCGDHDSYLAALDEVREVIQKYKYHFTVIWMGDLNGSLSRDTPLDRDKALQGFVASMGLSTHPSTPEVPTYYHHSGRQSSKIDHFMFLKDQPVILMDVSINTRSPINTSTHDAIMAKVKVQGLSHMHLQLSGKCMPPTKDTQGTKRGRVNWLKVNIQKYRELVQERLEILGSISKVPQPPEVTVDRISEILTSSAYECSPTSRPKPTTKKQLWNPTISHSMKVSKSIYAQWKAAGQQKDTALHMQMKAAKCSLRQAQRQAAADVRRRKFEDIMEASEYDQAKFFKLIKKQRTIKHKTPTHMEFSGQDLSDDSILPAWANYFEQLATPTESGEAENEFENSIELQLLLIEDIEGQSGVQFPEITPDEIQKAIAQLKNNKAPDELGVTSEHLKLAGTSAGLAESLAESLNHIVARKRNPATFSSGLVHPVPKKGKDPKLPDSYRRITITSLLGKILEKITLVKQKEVLSTTQNPLQRGFTERASSTNAALLLTEAILEAKDAKIPLFITLLDASKAFDVVWHSSMLVKLYEQGVSGDVWSLVADSYKHMTSRVKWQGETSRTIREQQGIRQGGLQSTEHFKARSNPLLDVLSNSEHSFKIGIHSVGIPTCADDMALISPSLLGMQVMLDLSAQDAKREKYTFSRAKSKVMVYNSNQKPHEWNEAAPLHLAESPLEVVAEQEHLGIIRSSQSTIHIAKERISLARRSLYALMGAGMYGWNGVNPVVSIKLWTTYILPRMTHSLEAIKVSKSDLKDMDQYQTTVLKQLQHLPERTSNNAAHLMLGAVPVSANIHRAVYTFFCNMVRQEGTVERNILERQLNMKGPTSHSWVNALHEIICQYDLPSALDVLANPPTKAQVKRLTRTRICGYWIRRMKKEASHQISLRHVNLQGCDLGKPHHLWSNVNTDAREVKKACVKVKLLLGQYNLQTAKHHTNSTCPLCKQDNETELHFVVQCPILQPARDGYLNQLNQLLLRDVAELQAAKVMSCERTLLQMILDCTLIPEIQSIISTTTLYDIEGTTRGLLYCLHLARQKLLGPCGQKCSKRVVCPRCIEADISDIDIEGQHNLGAVVIDSCKSNKNYAVAVLPNAGEEVS
jgi:hypothetical protein